MRLVVRKGLCISQKKRCKLLIGVQIPAVASFSTDAEKLGIIKSELHYLRKKAKSDKPFNVYGKVKLKLLGVSNG